MKILGLIPARGGSKGIPDKNIKFLGGKPLLAYTAESAKASNLLNRFILSSDDPAIIEAGKGLNIEIPFIRPSEISGDATTSLAVIQHALRYFIEQGEDYDAVCLLQPTTPFRSTGLIDEAIKKFKSGNFDSLISVKEVPAEFNPHWVFEAKDGTLTIATGEKEIIPRRQELPKAYHRDGAIYITKTSVLLVQNSLYGNNLGFIDTAGSPYVNIDTPEDWEEAEKIVNSGQWTENK